MHLSFAPIHVLLVGRRLPSEAYPARDAFAALRASACAYALGALDLTGWALVCI